MSSAEVSSPFESELIQVIVGDGNKRKFTVHQESSCSVVRLPEDNPEVFEVALSLAYHKVLDDTSFPKMTLGQELKLLAATYVLADKLGMESVGNDIIDRIKDIYVPAFLEQRELGATYWIFSEEEFILPLCKLRTFLIECLASRAHLPRPTWEKADADFYSLGGGHVSEIVLLMVGKGWGWILPWNRKDCDYHNHVDTTPCKENVKSKKRKAI